VAIVLRPLADDDLDRMFVWENDERAVEMAAFTRADSSDRRSFDAHYHRIEDDPDCTVLAVDDDGVLVGTIGSFSSEVGEVGREVTFWIDPGQWGRGLASAALRSFLDAEPTRPLFARVAEHNVGSATVLRRAGFVQVGAERGWAEGLGREVGETVHRLD
jgi:RimJ/RimL family protein N-acetyltransferase